MLPGKKSKPNPKAEREAGTEVSPASRPQDPEAENQALLQSSPERRLPTEDTRSVNSLKCGDDGANTPQSSKTWYGGTWPRGNKANAVTQVARESISAAGGAASEVLASAQAHTPQLPSTPLKTPAIYLSRSMGGSSRSLPLAATTTKLNITSNVPSPAKCTAKEGQLSAAEEISQPEVKGQSDGKLASREEKPETATPQEGRGVKDGADAESKGKASNGKKATNDSASWLNWFSRAEAAKADNSSRPHTGSNDDQIRNATKDRSQSTMMQAPKDTPASHIQRRNSEPLPVPPQAWEQPSSRSWLGLWSNATTKMTQISTASATGVATNVLDMSDQEQLQSQKPVESIPQSPRRPHSEKVEPPKSYGWAFWSRDQSKSDDGKQSPESGIGVFALAGSPSQSKPENAVIDEARGVPKKFSKRQKPQSLAPPEEYKKPCNGSSDVKKDVAAGVAATASKDKPAANVGTKAKRIPENLVLPPFKLTYKTVLRPGLIEQLSRLLHLSPQSEPKHLDIVQNMPQIKRALAIVSIIESSTVTPSLVAETLVQGVHGYFPAPLIRSVLGQPTGTSIRFANSAATAIQQWTQNQGYSCEIEKVALEGEGKITERIDLLWKLILNWIDKIRKADFVMIACHSQGVPVAMMLVSKLIAFGCLNFAKIGVCAMAGVNLGPFADYKSRWISGSAGELFDFALPDSQVSKDYEAALDVALRFGVKVVYIGSIDDQLVSLESSTFGTVSHPYIYRAVFVDGRVHAPDFLTHLVGFALKLRNLGISDHGLIRELSTPLAGSLYGGEGHSRIYDDEAVYHLTVEYALETTSVGNISLQVHRNNQSTTQNPYILPFAMRGLLEEDYVRTELYGEITELIKQFHDWKPSTKVLKDVKFRLEGVRSRL